MSLSTYLSFFVTLSFPSPPLHPPLFFFVSLQTADEMVAKKTDEAGGNTQAVLDADSDDGDEEEKEEEEEEEEEDSDEEIAQTGKRTLQPGGGGSKSKKFKGQKR